MTQKKSNHLAAALRGLFCDYLPKLKGTSSHTIGSYRDSVKLLLTFLTSEKNSVDSLSFEDIDVNKIIAFLEHLEVNRHNSSGTRNVRLSAIHSFFRYVATMFPEHLELAQRVLNIPFKRTTTRPIEYFEFEEISAVLEQIDRSTPDGQRDYALLALMFNTGARVQEVVDLKACDLHLVQPYSVHIFGKGRKERVCPIWPSTAHVLLQYIEDREIDARKPVTIFTNHLGTPLTRFGVRYILEKRTRGASKNCQDLKGKRLHPHSIRHSTAVHLLKSGVDLASIANWLGHASPNTTNKYATIDLEMKRQALDKATPPHAAGATIDSSWRQEPGILAWLQSL